MLFILSILFAFTTSSQKLTVKDGLYYIDNQKLFTGVYTSYFESGNKKSTANITEAGKQNGVVTYYYENGKVMETGAFVNDEKDGQWLRWDEAGRKIAEAFYVSGKKNGTWMIWDEKGTKRYEMFYAMGEKVGKWSMWDEAGKLTSEKVFSTI